jgi:purine-nucleoside phosphorylase
MTLQEAAGGAIDVAVILGSGLADAIVTCIENAVTIPYTTIPELPQRKTRIAGHRGEAIVGIWDNRRVAAFCGRFHLYQGYSGLEVAALVRLAAASGAQRLVLTNAAGALNAGYRVGDLMTITDQINCTGASPIDATTHENPFIPMADAYAPRLRALVPVEDGLHAGIYAGVRGPAYETPAESRFLRTIGVDAVGMSTVLETIAARALGLEVFGVSLITNTHDANAGTNHHEVLAAAKAGSQKLATLLERIVGAHSIR